MPARLALLLLLLPGAWLQAAEAPQRPNFVVIVADDLGWNDVGYHGSDLKTPHIDRLAREGVRLERHYVATMCSPTRAAFNSGRYWSRFGVTGAQNERAYPFDTVTLARALGSVGYQTAIVGKWHLGSTVEWGPKVFGFDHSYGSLAGGVGPYTHRYKVGPYSVTWHRDGQLIEQQGHVTDLLTADAVRWIETRRGEPFLLYVPFTAVHIPIDEPQRWLDLYSQVEPATARQYAASASHMDDSIGQIVAALDRAGVRDNTLVVFFSDNGAIPGVENNDTRYPGEYLDGPAGGSNQPLRGRKSQVYEGGIRVPAWANWPGKLPPAECRTPVHVVDWMPTLCALAGYQASAELKWDGTNIWGVLTGEAALAQRPLYCAGTGFRSAALVQGDWKLVAHQSNNDPSAMSYELYHLANDESESNDLAARQPERVAELKALLEQAASNDRDALPRD